MKTFTIVKVGYSAGIYGCSNEYFTAIYGNGKELNSVSFKGMYGAEERVSGAFQKKGYKKFYTQSFFGKMTRKDLTKNMIYESEAIEKVKAL
jgi:hypothetical protein